ncbi:putative uncharacterized protein [Parachlamydia acanthamoebae UV-7]|uniref:Uncharacterized protein n=1 Tax=Parachlamydia acanthamoebae (strain UV7) TaxID=765952 RepID=F8KZ17_PARAV|nr:hypothetical protein pah_c178o001 [Parachlamydia acanthamoebae str. Hall's coccus]CCB86140.1 putative uncharacterized protein [Parachlamydia acanthamoebae UV-7]
MLKDQNWLKSDLFAKRHVYIWVAGIYFNIRLEKIDFAF